MTETTETTTTMTGGIVRYVDDGENVVDLVLNGDTVASILYDVFPGPIGDLDMLRERAEATMPEWTFTWHGAPDVNGSTEGIVLDECTVTR